MLLKFHTHNQGTMLYYMLAMDIYAGICKYYFTVYIHAADSVHKWSKIKTAAKTNFLPITENETRGHVKEYLVIILR